MELSYDINWSWIASKVKCDLCSHIWIAVYPSTCDHLECPNCENLAIFEEI